MLGIYIFLRQIFRCFFFVHFPNCLGHVKSSSGKYVEQLKKSSFENQASENSAFLSKAINVTCNMEKCWQAMYQIFNLIW